MRRSQFYKINHFILLMNRDMVIGWYKSQQKCRLWSKDSKENILFSHWQLLVQENGQVWNDSNQIRQDRHQRIEEFPGLFRTRVVPSFDRREACCSKNKTQLLRIPQYSDSYSHCLCHRRGEPRVRRSCYLSLLQSLNHGRASLMQAKHQAVLYLRRVSALFLSALHNLTRLGWVLWSGSKSHL